MKYFGTKHEPIDHNAKRPRWRRGKQWSDAEIDTSDIPPLSEDFFSAAQMNVYRQAAQDGVSVVRIRWDFVDRLKSMGREAITRILKNRH
jgi:hypothetical protein